MKAKYTGKPKGRGYTPGAGRKKGTPNVIQRDLREMILGALNDVGGQAYLAAQAKKNPRAFIALVGKCLPKDLNINRNPDQPRVINSSKLSYDERQQLRDMILRAAMPDQPAIEHENGSMAAQEGLGAAIRAQDAEECGSTGSEGSEGPKEDSETC